MTTLRSIKYTFGSLFLLSIVFAILILACGNRQVVQPRCILPAGVNLEEALAIGERVRRAITGETDDVEDSLIRIPVRISMGVAEMSPDGTLDSLLRDADAALYRAKGAGRDKVST